MSSAGNTVLNKIDNIPEFLELRYWASHHYKVDAPYDGKVQLAVEAQRHLT